MFRCFLRAASGLENGDIRDFGRFCQNPENEVGIFPHDKSAHK